jgi:DNA-binding response OmpR family regulator
MGSPGNNKDNQADAPTVLVVEDEVLVRMATAEYLRECGYRVFEAGSGDEAVAVLQTDIRVDVVFTDVTMPGALNGFGLAQWVRRERPGVRVILTSGITRTAQEAQDLWAHGLLVEKPYDHRELDSRIQAILARR